MEAPRGAREPTGTNGPTLNNNPHHACGYNNKQRTINCRNHYTNHDQPTPPHANKQWGTVLNTILVVVMAPGKRPATFRTWKLSPAAPMVLQPIGCGRVGHRHNTPDQRGMTPHNAVSSLSFYTPTPSNRRNKRAPHTRPQFDQLTPRDTTHQRTNVAHICPRGMGCLMHGSFCTSARVASPQR